MTAAEIIALLRSHPKACGALGVRLDYYEVDDFELQWGSLYVLTDSSDIDDREDATKWLTGAATLKAIDLNICLPVLWREGWTNSDAALTNPKRATFHPTFLHATLAAIEASL